MRWRVQLSYWARRNLEEHEKRNNSIELLGSCESMQALMATFFPPFKGESLWIYLISTICRVILINIVWLKSARPKVALYTKSWCTTCVYWYSLKQCFFFNFFALNQMWKELERIKHLTMTLLLVIPGIVPATSITAQASTGKLHIINIVYHWWPTVTTNLLSQAGFELASSGF